MTLTHRALLQAVAGSGESMSRCRRARLGSHLARWSLLCWVLGCTPTGPGDTDKLPPNVQDPTVVKTPSGAMGFYREVVASMGGPVDALIVDVGIMTDELTALPEPYGPYGPYILEDSRQFDGGDLSGLLNDAYSSLHHVRGRAEEARGFLRAYLPDSLALRGHLFALEGYADVLLADVFCSGIPLSTVDFGADYTLAAGSSRDEVYAAAVTLFDSAFALTADNSLLHWLAAVGRGRALLALGQYAEAAAAVESVPTEFRHEVVEPDVSRLQNIVPLFQGVPGLPSMSEREGQNGLDYRSSGDPRTPAAMLDGQDPLGNMLYFPAKYPQSGPTAFVLADGIEARLIEAEAALASGGDWLGILNTLRQTVGLADTTDPGTGAARVDLLFRERAFWLYLTAHRQGDLRRLIRQYGRERAKVYPWGYYPGVNGSYGADITVPVPASEAQYNPNYTGCIDHNA